MESTKHRSQNSCPDIDSLQKYVSGKSHPSRVREVEEHLLHCPTCSQNADTLSPDDDITTAFGASSVIEAYDTRWREVIELAQKMATDMQAARVETVAITSPSEDTSRIDSSFPAAERSELDFLAPAEREDEIGRLGDYRVQAVLGSGGMGLVLAAEDPVLKRSIALKVMKPSAAKNRNARERFLREAQAAAAIEHDHVISIYQVGEDRGVPFIAMPMLKGESLRTLLDRERKLDQKEVIRIGAQIAEGLAAAHQCGLIHRDIKPDNIWIEAGTGRVKVLDFGLARMSADDVNLTHSGTVLGTPRYMAPEQAAGEVVDHRADLFSLGSVLYHLASGKAPFEQKSMTAMLLAVSEVKTASLAEVAPHLDPRVCKLVSELHSKNPNQRPQSASEVARLLGTIVEEPVARGKPTFKGWSTKQVATVAIGLTLFVALAVLIPIRLGDRTKVAIEPRSEDAALTDGKDIGELGHGVASTAIAESSLKGNQSTSSAVEDQEDTAAREVLAMGGVLMIADSTISAANELPEPPYIVSRVALTRDIQANHEDLSVLSRFAQLSEFEFAGNIADDAMKQLGEVSTLIRVVVFGNRFDWKKLDHLQGLTRLRDFGAAHCGVNNEDLIAFGSLKSVRTLNLGGNNISDDGLVSLQFMQLSELLLGQNDITDKGLQHLSEIKTLRAVNLYELDLTPAGLADFQRKLPNCRIDR